MAVTSKHNYGRAIDFRWRPLADDRNVDVAPTLVGARIYGPDSEPTESQKNRSDLTGQAGNEITSWTETDVDERSIIFDAVTDASPESTARYNTFFVVVNFKYDAAGPTVYDEEVIFLWRPDSLTSWPRVSAAGVYSLEPRVRYVAESQKWVESQIALAIEELFARLKAEGYAKHRLFNLEDFEPAALRSATAKVCYALEGEGNPHWGEKGTRWEKAFETMYKSVAVGYDLDDDDSPSPEEKRTVGAVAVMR